MRLHLPVAIACVTLLLARATPAQQLPADAVLVGHWSFDEGKGQTAGDTGEFENDGFLGWKMAADDADPQWVAEGKAGGCLRFDGEDDRVQVADAAPLALVRGVIVEAWVKQTKRTAYARIVDKGLTFDIYVHEEGWVSFRFRGAEAHGLHSSQAIPLGEWVKIRAEYDGQEMRLFINDKLVNKREYSEPIVNAGHELTIGATKSGRPFCGLIDEVKMWNLGYELPAALQRYEPDEHTVGLWHLALAPGPGRGEGRLGASQ